MQSHQMTKMVYDSDKSIIWNPTDDQRRSVDKCNFEVYEAWTIDLLVSTGEGKPREYPARTTIFKRNETIYQLKMKASRQFYSEVTAKFSSYPFNIRSIDDIRKARLGVTECAKHDVIQPLPVFCEKDDELVSQFKFTVLIMPNGPMRITGLPFDPACIKSDFKPKAPDVKDLLAQSIKIKKNQPAAVLVPSGDASSASKK
ncbi:unnamed protein product [Protopolystoma xenopodis]|uniref:Uncharacterized protein n=1 Tax=Protopolystoma xenopodis TaxID=117903 RepID=A0A448XPQ9_9PLAT|nr:unnamed protein product [Protopolystoma xenopodis]